MAVEYQFCMRLLFDIMFVGAPSIPGLTAYDKDGLKIQFEFERSAVDGVLSVSLTATNSNPAALDDFVFQAAVPKVSDKKYDVVFYDFP